MISDSDHLIASVFEDENRISIIRIYKKDSTYEDKVTKQNFGNLLKDQDIHLYQGRYGVYQTMLTSKMLRKK